MSLPAPFGKYELLEQIGSGGMADVFLARSFGVAGFEKRLVIKRIKPEHARDPRFVSLFIHEAKIGVHLVHPNIVQVYELGKVGDAWYIAMEHLHGRDLNQVVRALRAREERLPVPAAVRVVAEALQGLAFAHGDLPSGTPGAREGVSLVHRDVSPHNIFLTFAGEVKLVDFGIARMLADGDGAARKPASGPGGGKFAYMSPEQALGLPVDHRTDIFSAGVVLWELLAGERLFQAEDPEEKLRRVQQAVVPDPRTRGAAIDDALWAILRRALAREPDDRYETAAAFEEDLRAWLYERRDRPGRAALSRILLGLFPEASQRNPAAPDLRRLADDLRRLENDGTGTTQTPAASQTFSTASNPPAQPKGLRASEDERKRVIVVVIDIDGFTAISMHAEPEAIFKHHLQLLRWVRQLVDAHGGTIQHVHDDQVFVFFGLPRTRADDVQRALDFASALQRRVPELHEQGVVVHLAVGVHAGDVDVGRAGSRVRYMSRGNTTRLARRLSEQADHGQVVVSEEVFRAAETAFEFQRGPWLLGRGGKPPVASYLLSGRRTVTAPGPAQGVPWLRRGEELDSIREALVAAAAGRGSAVVIHGDAGAGKSRLVGELVTLARRRHVPVHQGRATGFGHPLSALRAVLLSCLGLPPEASEVEIRGHVERFRQLGLYPRDVEALEGLLGLRRAGDTGEVWVAFRRVLGALGQHSPVVVVLEDVEHLPEREKAHLAALVPRLGDSAVLLLLTCTGPVPPALEGLTAVHLGPLSEALQARMVAAWLEAERVHPELLGLVVRTCEGNPLYVTELLKYLVERGLVSVDDGEARIASTVDIDLPATLAGLLSARIDALDPGSKGALQLAAMIGPEFSAALLGDVIGVDDPIPLVDDLARHGLVRRVQGRDTWTFTSEFVRKAALHGILGVQKRDYHRLIAGALERRLGRDGDVLLDALAEHCGRGGRPLDGARYAHAAGRRREEQQELEEARACYQRGLSWLEGLKPDPSTWDVHVQGEVTLRLRLGAVCLALGDVRAGVAALRTALDVAEEAGLPWLELRAHLDLGRHHLARRELLRARAHLGQAAGLARTEEDRAVQQEVLEACARLAVAEGKGDEAVRLWEDALGDARDGAERARLLLGLAETHLRLGDAGAARPHLQAALEVARTVGDRGLEGQALHQLGLLHAWLDEPDEAVRLLRRAATVREEAGQGHGVVLDQHHIGDVHFLRGDLTRAWVAFRRSRDLAEELGWRRGVALNDVYLGYIDACRGDPGGPGRIEEALRFARRCGDVETAVSAAWLIGRLDLAAQRAEAARERLAAAHAEATAHHLPLLAAAIERTLAELPPPAGGAAPSNPVQVSGTRP